VESVKTQGEEPIDLEATAKRFVEHKLTENHETSAAQ
jgi:hypothetical protein